MTASPAGTRPAAARGTHALAALGMLLPLLRPYRGRVALAGFALVAAAGLVLGIGQGLRRLIDQGFAQAIDILAVHGVATCGRYWLVTWLGERVAADLRVKVFDHILSLSPAYFETARTGDILSRLSADVALLQALIGSSISMGIRNALMCVGALAMLLVTSAKLAAVFAVVVPLVVLPMLFFGRREKRISRQVQDRVADLGVTAEEGA